jgi:hypothetical protein
LVYIWIRNGWMGGKGTFHDAFFSLKIDLMTVVSNRWKGLFDAWVFGLDLGTSAFCMYVISNF